MTTGTEAISVTGVPPRVQRDGARRLPQIRRALVNMGLVAGSLLVALLLVEVAIRLIAPQQLILVRPDVWQAVDTVGWRFRPNLDTKVNWGERTVRVYTDQDGFRVGRSGRVNAPPSRRVLLMGDSFMAALQVEYEQSLAGLFESDLHVAVRNAGQAGWDPPQYYLGVREALTRDTFGLVVVSVYLGNDVVTSRPERIPPRVPVEIHHLRVPHSLAKAEVVDALVRPLNDYLEERSHLFIFVKQRLETLLMRAGISADYFPDEFRKNTRESSRWDVTTGMLADIATMASRRHIPTLFVLIPAPFQVDTATFHHFAIGFGLDSSSVDMDQPSRLIADRLRARHLDVVDVLACFRAMNANGPKLYGDVDRHLSPRGHEVLALLVEPRVRELLR